MKRNGFHTIGKDSEVVRPTSDPEKFLIEDGTFLAKIVDVYGEQRPSKYDGGADWTLLRLVIEVQNGNGDITKFYDVPLSWSSESKWTVLLSELGLSVDAGETFKLASLVGLPVAVEIENVKRSGRRYSNIVAVKKQQPRSVVRPPKKSPPAHVQRSRPKGTDHALVEDNGQDLD